MKSSLKPKFWNFEDIFQIMTILCKILQEKFQKVNFFFWFKPVLTRWLKPPSQNSEQPWGHLEESIKLWVGCRIGLSGFRIGLSGGVGGGPYDFSVISSQVVWD